MAHSVIIFQLQSVVWLTVKEFLATKCFSILAYSLLTKKFQKSCVHTYKVVNISVCRVDGICFSVMLLILGVATSHSPPNSCTKFVDGNV